MPHFGANLACGTSSALTTSGSAVALALGTRASRIRWRGLRTRARCSFSLVRPMSLRRRLVRGSAAAGRARRVVGGVDVSAELGASRLDALLGIQKLRVDITYGHRIMNSASGDTISERVIVTVQAGEEKSVELLRT